MKNACIGLIPTILLLRTRIETRKNDRVAVIEVAVEVDQGGVSRLNRLMAQVVLETTKIMMI